MSQYLNGLSYVMTQLCGNSYTNIPMIRALFEHPNYHGLTKKTYYQRKHFDTLLIFTLDV